MTEPEAHAMPQPDTPQPHRWNIVSGTLWAALAFLGPQYALFYLIGGLVLALPADGNTRQFIFQGLSELCTVGLLWLVLSRVYRVNFQAIGLGRFKLGWLGRSLLALPAYLATSIVITTVVAAILPRIDLSQAQDVGYQNPTGFDLVVVFLALVCLAPLVEELLFRGFLFNAFVRTFGFWVGAAAVSLLFAVAHGQLNVGIDVFVLSMFLCYLRQRTGSLWPSIGLHALKNLVAFAYLFIIHIK